MSPGSPTSNGGPSSPQPTHNMSKLQIVLLGIVVASGESSFIFPDFSDVHVAAYIVWGILISLQPPFYPLEAEKKGATPHQVSLFL